MEMIQSIIVFVRESAKRVASFKKLVQEDDSAAKDVHIRPLCDTRWVLRLPAMETFIAVYSQLLDWMEAMSNDRDQPATMRAKVQGLLQNMESFKMFFLVRILHRLFSTIHPVHTAMQGRTVTIGATRRYVEQLASILGQDASDDLGAAGFYTAVKAEAIDLGIDLPSIPRGHAEPRRRGQQVDLEIQEEQIEAYYTDLYKSVFSAAVEGIFKRYHSPSMQKVEQIDKVLADPNTGDEVIHAVCNLYKGDIREDHIRRQREQWFGLAQTGSGTDSANTH